jgi:bacterioferritin
LVAWKLDVGRWEFTKEAAFMRGNDQVIAQLNQALKEELTAINQYFLHAEMCHNWGYHKLGDYIRKQSIDEMKHAEELIERLLFLDATPQMEYMELSVGGNVRQQLEADLKLEHNAVRMYNDAIRVSRDSGDDASRDLFSKLLRDEEEHVDWLEAQMQQIKDMGYERYLSNQTEGSKD